MGSHAFTNRSTERDATVAYKQLCSQALAEHGSDSYNGTISTTSGFKVVSSKPISPAQAQAIMDRRIEHLSKWSTCEAIAVGTPVRTRPKTLWLTIPGDSETSSEVVASADKVAAAIGVSPSRIASYEILESSPKISIESSRPGPAHKVWVTSDGRQFESRAEAVKHARDTLRARHTHVRFGPSLLRSSTITVQPTIVHTPPAALVATVSSWRVKVRAQVAQEVPGEMYTFDHWLFYGWVAT